MRAPRVTLDEILDRVARGEARRDSALQDLACTAAVRTFHRPPGGTDSRLYMESVWRVYRKRPERLRTVLLRLSRGPAAKNEKDVDVDFAPDMGERIVDFAFRPSARRSYRYRIVGRDLVGGHLLYRLAFEPRSVLDAAMPSGLAWVDTNEFVIVREELGFEHSPVPLFIRRLNGMVIERQRVQDTWVLKRLLLSVDLTLSVPTFGRHVEFAVVYDDYAINRGIDDALFLPAAGRR